eukprot:GHRR01033348.1.p1 GENE.GHRR01033348.1~~GHRR01033348.1.p1  ORF type:complete len:118 (-),score=5.59 GHRR01033348.1:153-506(-)
MQVPLSAARSSCMGVQSMQSKNQAEELDSQEACRITSLNTSTCTHNGKRSHLTIVMAQHQPMSVMQHRSPASSLRIATCTYNAYFNTCHCRANDHLRRSRVAVGIVKHGITPTSWPV